MTRSEHEALVICADCLAVAERALAPWSGGSNAVRYPRACLAFNLVFNARNAILKRLYDALALEIEVQHWTTASKISECALNHSSGSGLSRIELGAAMKKYVAGYNGATATSAWAQAGRGVPRQERRRRTR